MIRAAVCGTVLLLGCPQRPDPTDDETEPVVTLDNGRIIDLTARGGGGAGEGTAPREIHPREGRQTCVEMYTVCVTEKIGENCASARLDLACEESGMIPSTGELLKCVCP